MAGSSNPLPPTQDLAYLYASNANVSNFVSVKLSDNNDYRLWKAQMLCLMESHNMRGIVDHTYAAPSASSLQIMNQYDSLLKGWIFGSLSKDALGTVVDLDSAKDVWKKLQFAYDPVLNSQQDSTLAKQETNTVVEVNTVVLVETDMTRVPVETETKAKDTEKETKGKDEIVWRNKRLRKATVEGDWGEVEAILKDKIKDAAIEAISNDGNTMLHIAVGIARNDFVRTLLQFIKDGKALEMKNSDGSTALHVAALVGNTDAAKLLVKKHKSLLDILDNEGHVPLYRAYYNMQIDTFVYLLETSGNGETKALSSGLLTNNSGVENGIDLLVNAISARQYTLALRFVKRHSELAVKNDFVLMAIARTFPSGLDFGEAFIYPSWDDVREKMVDRSSWLFFLLKVFILDLIVNGMRTTCEEGNLGTRFFGCLFLGMIIILLVPLFILYLVYQLIRLLMLVVYLPFFLLYFLLWKVAATIIPPIKHIEKKKREHEEAKEILKFVCDEIEKSKDDGKLYTEPILEAARQNAYDVVDEILYRSPEAIRCKSKSGHDIIQLAVIHRSERIYSLIYHIGERKNLYRTMKDSSHNNMLHLAGRMAPSHKLNRRAGAALQLQRELQWREEVEKLVFPSYTMEKNVLKETPEMVFTREHANLVKEGESWMKTMAESCSITAALITTIVFAAAITVPGGSNQTTGIPLFTKEIAFIFFAVSDAISLFTSTTSLLMFLSILTARFAEQDFLVSLPRRLLIGLCTLLISTTAMMVAFSATLFLVFCDEKLWMLAPICGLACLPIAFFVTLQFPLIVDLSRSTYGHNFSKQSTTDHGRLDLNNIRSFLLRVQ